MSTQRSQSQRKPRLGRGLSSLIGEVAAVEPKHLPNNNQTVDRPALGDPAPPAPPPADEHPPTLREGLHALPLDAIRPGRFQPRTGIDQAELTGLADSIRTSGVMQPIAVRRLDKPGPDSVRFELIAGERRWRAAELAGLDRVPAMIVNIDDHQAAEWGLVENLQRQDLSPMDRADGLRSLADRFGSSHAEIGQRLGLDRSTVANLIRLTDLEPEIRELLRRPGRDDSLSVGHGKALLAAPAGPKRVALAQQAARNRWSVRELEKRARALAATPPTESTRKPQDERRAAVIADLERRLTESLATRVRIRSKANGSKGAVVIEFYDLDQFDGLLRKLGVSDNA